jgi:hypothetical protein
MRIPLSVARLLRPELLVTGFSFMVPDLVDKPLWVLGVISDGRFIGHTLLSVSLVAIAFSIKKRVYGLFALCGGMLHLLLDTSGFIPWFYPFKGYEFPTVDFHHIVTLPNVIETLAEMVLVVLVVFLALSLVLWLRQRRKASICRASQSDETAGREE